MKDAEEPVVASVQSAEDWILITTQRVLIGIGGRSHSIAHTGLSHTSVDATACINAGQVDTYMFEYISVDTHSGLHFVAHVQPGGGFLGILSLLKMLESRTDA